jgi:prepilin-type N-terminal cleavage/methylation domain-containing protein/prepilin-type processing-associated H-X9-DG protein
MRASRAFTLVELLVAIAVIAILAAMFLSAFSRTRATTLAITCRNNLRQWGLATQAFATDHEDFFPKNGSSGGNSTGEGWYVDLPMELNLPTYHEMPWRTNANIDPGNSIWICPSNARRSNGNNLFHYCLNENVNGTGSSNQVKMASIRQPTTMIWLFDNGGAAPVAQWNNVHSNLHSRGAQFLFIDGHVARFRNKEYWNFTTKQGITNNPELVWIP